MELNKFTVNHFTKDSHQSKCRQKYRQNFWSNFDDFFFLMFVLVEALSFNLMDGIDKEQWVLGIDYTE